MDKEAEKLTDLFNYMRDFADLSANESQQDHECRIHENKQACIDVETTRKEKEEARDAIDKIIEGEGEE